MDEKSTGVENGIFPRIMFAAPKSGSGKTVITCAFLNILKRRGMDAVSFKCGPDYIDPLIHASVTGIPAVNLDSFFLERDDIRNLFTSHFTGPESIAVIEGVMGYCDGIAGTTRTASSYDIADCLDCPVIIILDMTVKEPSPEEQLKDLLDRVQTDHIEGVILNRATPDDAGELCLKTESLGVRSFGYVPECEEARLDSRHLGLEIPLNAEKFLQKISALSDIIEETVDVDGLMELARNASSFPGTERAEAKSSVNIPNGPSYGGHPAVRSRISKGTIAVAHDEAFCFQYEDNLDLLRDLGYGITTFSPLRDKALPDGICAILLCGGYPEVYARELSDNVSMLNAIDRAFGTVKIMAECGGFLYLHESLEGMDGLEYPMAGCIKAKAFKAGRSPRFGYISLCSKNTDAVQIPDGEASPLIRAHEFHYWESSAPGTDLLAVKPQSGRSWDCCYLSPYLLAGFPHLYYRSGPEFIDSFLSGEDALC